MALVYDLEQLYRASLEAGPFATLPASPAGSLQGPAPGSARAWWERHQVVASVVYALTIYPAWHARVWIAKPWNMFLFFALLAAAASAISVRLHLFFTSRSYPSELAFQRQRVRGLTRLSDTVFVVALLLAALAIGADHSLIAALLLTVSVATTVSMLIIEPATARAAFSDQTPR